MISVLNPVIAILLTLSSATAGVPAVALTQPSLLPDLVEKVMPGVVNVSSISVINYQIQGMDDFLRFWGAPSEQKQTSLGSGFIIDRDGYILTNHHVVQHATEVLVTLFNKKQYRAKIVGRDQKLDLALIQIVEKDRKNIGIIKSVPMGDSDAVRIAETVVAVGNPFGLQGTVTAGIISAKNRTIGIGPFDNFLQTDASINPGNSGGPLFNIKGEVIGINTVIFSKTGQSGGLGFAIPSNAASALIPDLKRYGHVQRPWLGIVAQTVTEQLQFNYGLASNHGVLIINVIEDGPADSATLQRADIILKVNGSQADDNDSVERILSKLHPKDTITLSVKRGRRVFDIKLKLDELPPLENLPQGII